MWVVGKFEYHDEAIYEKLKQFNYYCCRSHISFRPIESQ